jgi:hypothetical protein
VGNLALIALGLFGLGAAWCCISGGLIDSVVREAVVEAIEQEQRGKQPTFTFEPPPVMPSFELPSNVPVEQGLRQNAPAAGPPPEVVPDQGEGPSFRPGQPVLPKKKASGSTEDDLFGVQ